MVDKDKAVWCEHPYCTREHYEGHGLCSFEMDNAELCTDPTCNAARAGIPHAADSAHTGQPWNSTAEILRARRDEADRKAAVCFLVAAALVAAGILVVFVLQIVGV